MSFSDLPLELVQRICDYYVTEFREAPMDDERFHCWPGDLRTICRKFDNAIQPLIFERITFNFRAEQFYGIETQVKDLASSQCPAHLFTKCLHIYALRDLRFTPDTFHGSGQLGSSLTSPCFEELLTKAIRNLKNLRSLFWRIWDEYPVPLVIDALLSLESLTSVSIRYPDLHLSGFPTFSFSNLTHFSLSVGSPNYPGARTEPDTIIEQRDSLLRQLEDLVLRSPNLARLSVSLDERFWHPVTTFLLTGTLESATQLEILKLRGVQISSANPINTHKLSTLTITSCGAPSYTALLDQLMDTNVHLRVLKCGMVTKALINYINSYSGVEKLSLELAEIFYDDEDGDEAGDQETLPTPGVSTSGVRTPNGRLSGKFGSILQKHQDTLAELSVRVPYGGPWCVTNQWADALVSCVKLVYLGITLPSERLCDFSQDDDTTIGVVHVKNIITTCSTHLRALKHLRIFSSNVPGFRDRYRRRRVSAQIEDMISRTICELEIPDPAVYSFQIRKGCRVYEVQKGDEAVYRYCERRLDPQLVSNQSDSESDYDL
ncbi:uncharacterized protein LACBIDRAFT_298216 [Laccaria bicolor S238N-H82]|uniref:Predicted protein n=1 Tax=Laccaria bicolor (strain S238N-H82 / ATCC MYA-4686) TaxID=486041 RepID=B0DCH2_LACBS|nr:uncharacterized protein LACBIDRAFT_298216 [Laccaria bicolor S238N-H82]EDR07729.1 predicted protein [Laccaria bicolor S238N-H82]|eukprot:XP_001881518.1 predicted protein [Laccaria bicolor S238N-H82]